MRCLNEYIAKKADKADKCTGRLWEGRFKSTALLDPSAVVAGLTYVDLNPIRAGVADTPEESNFTSGQDRIVARQARKKLPRRKLEKKKSSARKKGLTPEQVELVDEVKLALERDTWLSSFGKVVEGEPKSFLNMELDDYLELLDWTARQVKEGKRSKIPGHVAHILERLEIETDAWVHTVLHFGSLFHRVAGKVQSILRATRYAGQKWLRGKPNARQVFGWQQQNRIEKNRLLRAKRAKCAQNQPKPVKNDATIDRQHPDLSQIDQMVGFLTEILSAKHKNSWMSQKKNYVWHGLTGGSFR